MQAIKDSAFRLTNDIQGVIGYIEEKKPKKALIAAKKSILELQRMITTIAANTMTSITSEDTTELHRVVTELAVVTAQLHLITAQMAENVGKRKPMLVRKTKRSHDTAVLPITG